MISISDKKEPGYGVKQTVKSATFMCVGLLITASISSHAVAAPQAKLDELYLGMSIDEANARQKTMNRIPHHQPDRSIWYFEGESAIENPNVGPVVSLDQNGCVNVVTGWNLNVDGHSFHAGGKLSALQEFFGPPVKEISDRDSRTLIFGELALHIVAESAAPNRVKYFLLKKFP